MRERKEEGGREERRPEYKGPPHARLSFSLFSLFWWCVVCVLNGASGTVMVLGGWDKELHSLIHDHERHLPLVVSVHERPSRLIIIIIIILLRCVREVRFPTTYSISYIPMMALQRLKRCRHGRIRVITEPHYPTTPPSHHPSIRSRPEADHHQKWQCGGSSMPNRHGFPSRVQMANVENGIGC